MIKKISEVYNRISENETDLIFLVHVIDDKSGFFLHDNKFIFAEKNIENERLKLVKTDYLTMKTNVSIEVVSNDPTFEVGEYNLIYFNGNFNDDKLDLFVELCSLYTVSKNNITFYGFFNQMYQLFQKSDEKNKKDLIGIIGELFFIMEMYENGIDLMSNWQTTGKYSKYDFIIDDLKIEVKTTTKSIPIFKIKHDQIFTNNGVFVVTININEDNSGVTILELINKFKKIEKIQKNFSFMYKLNSLVYNLKRDSESTSKKYNLKEVKIFDASNLSRIEKTPENVFNLQYDYNFITEKSLSIIEFISILKSTG